MAAPGHQAQTTAAGITATRLPAANGRIRVEGPTRWDQWWVEPALIVLVLGAFIVYSTWAALQNAHYYAAPYLSPFYSPCPTFPFRASTPGWCAARGSTTS